MHRMLAMGTAVGAAFGCGKETTKAVDGPSRGCGSHDAQTQSQPDANASTGGSGASGSSGGYAVVDPMPPPARCPGVAATLKPVAKFEKGEAGALELAITIPAPTGRDDFKYVNDAPPYVYGCTVVSHAVTKKGAVVRVRPTAGLKNVSVSVKTMCNQGPGTMMASVQWTEAPTVATKPLVTLNEY
jgi:hypothetical protein